MTKIGITTILLCFLSATMASAGESYLCVVDMATGFSYNKTIKKWKIANFNADDRRYVVSKSKSHNYVWEVKEIGETISSCYCKEDFTESGYLECEGPDYFYMSKNNLRFLLTNRHGYVHPNTKKSGGDYFYEEGDVTPFMAIGKCSPLP